jgi:hypothetical protein
MKKLFAQMLLLLLFSSLCLAQSNSSSQSSAPSNRAEAEKAIRSVLYEMSVATQTGDAKIFRKHAAQRTLKFYDLLAEELLKNSNLKEQFNRAGVTNGESFIEFSFRGIAQRVAATPRPKIEELARGYAASPLTFVSQTEAKVETNSGTIRIIWEADEWKVDSTDETKKVLLGRLPLSAESKTKLEKF